MTLRRRLVLLGVVGVGAVGALAFANLGDALVYYKTPTEVTAHRPAGRIRLGGMVQPGSVHKEDGGVRFVLTDGAADVSVLHRGDPPGVFQEGQGALVEGTFDPDGAFHSDTLIVKHSNQYKGPGGKTYQPPLAGGSGVSLGISAGVTGR